VKAPGRYDHAAQQQIDKRPNVVLIVDDDATNLKVLKGYLSLDGYDVALAESGPEALERLAQGDVDLVVLDVRMPEMDGFEVCRRIRQNPNNARLPVVFLTADQADESREFTGLEAGGDEFLHKPISRRVLSTRVRNLLRLANMEHEKKLMGQVVNSEKLAAIGQIAAGVAHEVNNPLAFILSNLESLRTYLDDMRTVIDAWHGSRDAGLAMEKKVDLPSILDDVGPLLDETLQGGRRVRAIVQELKTFARNADDHLEPMDLSEVAKSTLLLTERELCAKAMLVKEFAPAGIDRGPKQKLHQVVLNLIVNAMHAIEGQPNDGIRRHVIRVTTKTEGEFALLEVADSGCGIAEENLRRIFEPFFTTKPVGIGTGLGLSLCAMTVQRLGGRIDVTSAIGKGTSFTVRIPRVVQLKTEIESMAEADAESKIEAEAKAETKTGMPAPISAIC
jgi:signal transduction histidine kinase